MQRHEDVPTALQHGAQVELRVVQETDQQLERTVAGAASDAVDRRVEPVGPATIASIVLAKASCWLLCPWKPTSLPVPFDAEVHSRQVAHLLGVKRAETVHQVHRLGGALGDELQGVRQVVLVNGRRP